MNLLAIETSDAACSIALQVGDAIHARHEVIPMQQSQVVLPWIDELLRAKSITLNQLDAIAFGCGPGSFTGIRLATSIAQGLGYGAGLPLIPVSSLAILAQTAYQTLGWDRVLVAVDARMQEIYTGAYELSAEGHMISIQDDQLCAPDKIQWPPGAWRGVGNAWTIYPDPSLEVNTTLLPMASALLTLAIKKYTQQEWVRPQDALPVYLRDTVAWKT